MTIEKGFDNEKYLEEQSAAILERVRKFNKLYLEFGGKILFDLHASRVLPGFNPNAKMKLLEKLKDKVEMIICIYAGDIERKKVRADFGITYDQDTMKLIDDFKSRGILVNSVVITRYNEQPAAKVFKNVLERRGIKVYTHRFTKGYPTDVDTIVSPEGYGANDYIETTRPIVVVNAPGPGSGKLATCLSQLYHDHVRGINAGYAKFETFPVWSLPLKHNVNVAYEAATADLKDVNLIDHFHLDAYDKKSVNYNRDLEAFPLLKRIIEKITGKSSFYKSPTDMGVNRAGFAIYDDKNVSYAAAQEVIRRFFRYSCEFVNGSSEKDVVQRVELLMEDLGVKPEDRVVVMPARKAAAEARERRKDKKSTSISCGAAIELKDGSIITGKNSYLLHSVASLMLNTVKELAGIPDEIHLLPQNIIESVGHLKKDVLQGVVLSLDLKETLIALSISATVNPTAQIAIEKLKELRGCEVHLTHMPTPSDEASLRSLGVNFTSDPEFASEKLFVI